MPVIPPLFVYSNAQVSPGNSSGVSAGLSSPPHDSSKASRKKSGATATRRLIAARPSLRGWRLVGLAPSEAFATNRCRLLYGQDWARLEAEVCRPGRDSARQRGGIWDL